MSDALLVERSDGVLTLTLNRPKANAFDQALVDALLEAFKQAGRDAAVRCVLLTGAGRFFSAGQDVKAMRAGDGGEVSFRKHLQHTYNPLILRMRALEKPVVGAINGPAVGAGLGIALATDIRLAAESASFIYGFTGIGLSADSATSLYLPLLIGLARASEMAFTNDPLSAQDALAYGLVNHVLPDDDLMPEAQALAGRLAQGPTLALGLTKRAFNRTLLANLEATLDYEAHLQEVAGHSDDHQEGKTAFLEKRTPAYKGR